MPRGARSPICVTSLTTSDEALIPVWRTPRRRLLRGLLRAFVAEGGEQLGGGAGLRRLGVRVRPPRHPADGVARPPRPPSARARLANWWPTREGASGRDASGSRLNT